MPVEPGSRVKIDFTATYLDGDLIDTSAETVAAEHGVAGEKRFRPIVLEVDADPGIESLQEGLVGLNVGETRTIEVPHEDLQVT
ncbi:MAG: FKBP-type peptidyl-prolyl cis-trans isomerase [Haloarculaceae archaeon]